MKDPKKQFKKNPGIRGLFLLGLVLLLPGCAVRGSAPPVQLGNFSFYSSVQDSSGRYVICDNLETRLVYSFDYLGYLESWESVLVGEETGEERARRRFMPDEPFSGTEPITVSVTYILLPRSAPLSLTDIDPVSIIVEPIGGQGTRLELTIRSRGGFSRTFTSRSIPIVPHC